MSAGAFLRSSQQISTAGLWHDAANPFSQDYLKSEVKSKNNTATSGLGNKEDSVTAKTMAC